MTEHILIVASTGYPRVRRVEHGHAQKRSAELLQANLSLRRQDGVRQERHGRRGAVAGGHGHGGLQLHGSPRTEGHPRRRCRARAIRHLGRVHDGRPHPVRRLVESVVLLRRLRSRRYFVRSIRRRPAAGIQTPQLRHRREHGYAVAVLGRRRHLVRVVNFRRARGAAVEPAVVQRHEPRRHPLPELLRRGRSLRGMPLEHLPRDLLLPRIPPLGIGCSGGGDGLQPPAPQRRQQARYRRRARTPNDALQVFHGVVRALHVVGREHDHDAHAPVGVHRHGHAHGRLEHHVRPAEEALPTLAVGPDDLGRVRHGVHEAGGEDVLAEGVLAAEAAVRLGIGRRRRRRAVPVFLAVLRMGLEQLAAAVVVRLGRVQLQETDPPAGGRRCRAASTAGESDAVVFAAIIWCFFLNGGHGRRAAAVRCPPNLPNVEPQARARHL